MIGEFDWRNQFRAPWMGGALCGTPAWIRTKDQLIKSQLLYQLSYRGISQGPKQGSACGRRSGCSKTRQQGNRKMRDGVELLVAGIFT